MTSLDLLAGPALTLADPALRPDLDVSAARRILAAYRPADRAQTAVRDRILDFIDRHPLDAHLRSCREGHLTASALVVAARPDEPPRVLLTHHRKLDRWLQLGGHCDGDANLPGVALREATEESGLADLAVAPAVVDVDVHLIPARPGEPAHLHLDTRFFVTAPHPGEPVVSDESHALRWLTLGEARALAPDPSVCRLLDLLARSEH